jgi:hypothetical protein
MRVPKVVVTAVAPQHGLRGELEMVDRIPTACETRAPPVLTNIKQPIGADEIAFILEQGRRPHRPLPARRRRARACSAELRSLQVQLALQAAHHLVADGLGVA